VSLSNCLRLGIKGEKIKHKLMEEESEEESESPDRQ